MNWNIFTKSLPKVEYRTLELSKPVHLAPVTPELKDSLRALQLHPGFQYLMSRLSLEQANVKKFLEEGFKATETELRFLQAGVYYTGWLQREIERLTSVPRPAAQALEIDDQQLFEEINSQMEVIR